PELSTSLRKSGAGVRLITDGDIAGVIDTVEPEATGIDMYIGVGGAPEGVLAAAALRCIGGQMQCRLVVYTPASGFQSTDGANPFLALCLNGCDWLRRKLEHRCFLTHQQVSQQYLLPVGRFQEIMMMVVLMGLPKGGHRVIDHYHVPSEQTARAAPYRRCEGK